MTDRVKTIGILGGGQLGRMLALAAARLGYRAHIYSPPGDTPAIHVTHVSTLAEYDDKEALLDFAKACDVITYEFENVPASAAELLQQEAVLRPDYDVLRITQDRWLEKSFIAEQGIAVPAFANVTCLEDLQAAVAAIGRPSVLKTRRLGYDGKGQVRIRPDTDLADAWAMIGQQPAILEAFVPFEAELSVIVARDVEGHIEAYDIPENVHENHILKTSTVPSGAPPEIEQDARDIAFKLAQAFNYIGVFAVELFLVKQDGAYHLLVNEIAPRVHNSGHWTEAACAVSQFEQHIRAVTGMVLGSAARHCDARMTNLLGAEIDEIRLKPPPPMTMMHDYGKANARPGRKMGHEIELFPFAGLAKKDDRPDG